MRSQALIFSSTILLSLCMFGCGGTTPSNSNAINATNVASNNPLETTKPTPEQTTNRAPTLTPVFKAYCDAWVKNNEAALRKVYSSDTIKNFEEQMKDEKETSLIKFLEATDKVSGNPCEVTNEKIEGDKALATIRSNKYPTGITVVFVKENGEWKLTNKSPAIDAVKASNSNSNVTK